MAEVELVWHGDKVGQRLRRAAAQSLFDAAAALLQEANKKCPHRTGHLQGTGKADVDEMALAGWVTYDTPYAVRLHEHPEYRFGENREGRWLANALERMHDRLLSYLREGLSGALE